MKMAVKCVRLHETEEKKYHHNIPIIAVFNTCSIYGHLYFIVKAQQAGVQGAGMLTYGI